MKINGEFYRSIWPDESFNSVYIIDQTKLPHFFEIARIEHFHEMLNAIMTMQVRGAPLIGASAAYGIALAMLKNPSDENLKHAKDLLIGSRPTAVNLRWAVERMYHYLLPLSPSYRNDQAWSEASRICEEDIKTNQSIGVHGLELLRQLQSLKSNKPLNILTHCNAGWLATVDYGTALAPVFLAHQSGMPLHVWVDETRPRNQGASLTAWELNQQGIDHTVVSDNAGGHLMQRGQVDMVLVGADRVTSQGDVCNKIGTYLKALSAFDCKIPFFAAVPSTTIDLKMKDGLKEIDIEERSGHEVSYIQGLAKDGSMQTVLITPKESKVANPAFDVTPARLVSGIITEQGTFPPGELASIFAR